jgi:putative phosphoribosyl transferase
VDDGLASGYTMLAAITFVKRKSPLKIIVAVPTASKKTVDSILPEVDELVCLNIRSGYPFAVADAYEDWYDLTDEDVLELLKKDHQ